jgi:cytochrome c biogenesis protein CcmG/thiol:disulfide interchange protein DsbE
VIPLLRLAGAFLLVALAMGAARADEPAVALDQHGRSHAWKGPSGELTLLDFAASWCAPCAKTLPRLEAFAREHPDLRVVTVSVDERRQGRDDLVASLHLGLPMLWDEGHRIAEHYQPRAMPAAFLISPSGEVLHTALGSGDEEWDELVRRVQEELRRVRRDQARDSGGTDATRREWSGREDLNLRPHGPEPCALPS